MKTLPIILATTLLTALTMSSKAQDNFASADSTVITKAAYSSDVNKTTYSNINAKANKAKAHVLVHDYFAGADAADTTYKAKNSGKRVVFFATLVGSPVLGLIPALMCSAKTPNIDQFAIKNRDLVSNTAFMKGYRHEARKIKRRAIWGNYIAASTLWIGIAQFIL
jgi:hypothetical protein